MNLSYKFRTYPNTTDLYVNNNNTFKKKKKSISISIPRN